MKKITRRVKEMPIRMRYCYKCGEVIESGTYYSLPKLRKVACLGCGRKM